MSYFDFFFFLKLVPILNCLGFRNIINKGNPKSFNHAQFFFSTMHNFEIRLKATLKSRANLNV